MIVTHRIKRQRGRAQRRRMGECCKSKIKNKHKVDRKKSVSCNIICSVEELSLGRMMAVQNPMVHNGLCVQSTAKRASAHAHKNRHVLKYLNVEMVSHTHIQKHEIEFLCLCERSVCLFFHYLLC